ncbi:hypothetical protein GCM10009718_00090 [Isoptericola halotolerans]|uniref:UDP-N-acetylmuramyl pentapeptide phosphotransferase/UDP-N-acetylglucosamine-1-phosphate transferase n=1 Tax=Isoptericola halotolerans TaxID=300560 RepID=A0ABX2A910_9MICO|nr:hypothetical protein [Isoptericola halotolerans]NOV98357.1 UDP-N-acetylmuramyl pentapeptide phosphotransferase/UDP-N-acetylglucosamine-1-phosphate transferase [Isoptericola halotolerans]
MGVGRFAAAGVVAAAVTAAARRVLQAGPPGGAERWTRTNHGGEPVSMLEGPAVAAGLVAGAAVSGGPPRVRTAVALACAGAGALGVLDDLAEDTSTRTKGLRGHLGALARGRLTTGGLKVVGIGASSLAAAAVGTPRHGGGAGRALDVAVNGALIAGAANLVNLLDLRPGRALKASALLAAPVAAAHGGGATGALLGAAAAAAPEDLAERDMLGDGGANALGAYVGTCWALGAPRTVRVVALAAVVGLTLASERVSFSAVIDRTPWLRTLDQVGRRPVPAAAEVEEGGAALAPGEDPAG